jgi:dolichol-phosphate mannosyltransferase
VVPLRIATYSGALLVFLSFLGAVFYFVWKFVKPGLPVGLASIHILVLFGIGFQSLLLGVLGEYLLRIYVILRKEPIALIEESLNLDSGDLRL